MMQLSLFDSGPARPPLWVEPGALWLPGAVSAQADHLYHDLLSILAAAPLRAVMTPGGRPLSVQMSNCGRLGWVSDRRGYRYEARDPVSGQPWPVLPTAWQQIAQDLAAAAGFANFTPDACLINRYAVGAKMGRHQDRDEVDFLQPIVSLSLGLPARFEWGGATRGAAARMLRLEHGDALVWGGPARLRFHGVLPLEAGHHPLTGAFRFNLTFRCAR